MARGAAVILMLMLTLPAAALVIAADGVDVDTIRLPSDGGEDLAAAAMEAEQTLADVVPAALGEGEERPWTCCNSTVCTKSIPPTCRCLDDVEECAPACKACVPSGCKLSFHVCNDEYHGDPGPTCGEEERPWACCDRTVCTESFPPTCRCLDEVEECAPACKRCEPLGINPNRHVCHDQYHGDPGPTCNVPAGSPSVAAAAQIQLLLVSLILLEHL